MKQDRIRKLVKPELNKIGIIKWIKQTTPE